MSVLDSRLESARSVFMQHHADCATCRAYDFQTAHLTRLCWRGTQFYKALLDLETQILTRQTAAEKAAWTRQQRAEVEAHLRRLAIQE